MTIEDVHAKPTVPATVGVVGCSGVANTPMILDRSPNPTELPWDAVASLMTTLQLPPNFCEIVGSLFLQRDFDGVRRAMMPIPERDDAAREQSVEAARNTALLISPPAWAASVAGRISVRLDSALSESDLSVLAHALVEDLDTCDWERMDAVQRALMDPVAGLLMTHWQFFDPESFVCRPHGAEFP